MIIFINMKQIKISNLKPIYESKDRIYDIKDLNLTFHLKYSWNSKLNEPSVTLSVSTGGSTDLLMAADSEADMENKIKILKNEIAIACKKFNIDIQRILKNNIDSK